MPRSENKTTPKLSGGMLYGQEVFNIADMARWHEWLTANSTFYADLPEGTFTARRELRRGSWFWYAFRRSAGKLHKVYIGKLEDLTEQRLHEVAQQLADKVASVGL